MSNTNTSYRPISLLPKNYPIEEHALDIATGIRIDGISVDLQKIKTLANPFECPIEFLPVLAHSFGADFYWELENLSEKQQREYVAETLRLHQKKGTKWAIDRVLEILNPENETKISEWFEYGGDPYYFRVNLVLNSKSKKKYGAIAFEELKKYIWKYKNVRSHLDSFMLEIPVSVSTEIGSESSLSLYLSNKINLVDKAGAIEFAIANIHEIELQNSISLAKKMTHMDISYGAINNLSLECDFVLEDEVAAISIGTAYRSEPHLSNEIAFDSGVSSLELVASTVNNPLLSKKIYLPKKSSNIKLCTATDTRVQLKEKNIKKGETEMSINITGAVVWVV